MISENLQVVSNVPHIDSVVCERVFVCVAVHLSYESFACKCALFFFCIQFVHIRI